jgi:hypothetical protein
MIRFVQLQQPGRKPRCSRLDATGGTMILSTPNNVRQSWIRSLFVTLVALGVAGCQGRTAAPVAAPSPGMSAERLRRVDEHFHRLVDEGKIAGVVTWVARRGQVVHEDAYGLADIDAKRPMTGVTAE